MKTSPMVPRLGLLVVLAVAIVAIGLSRGWFDPSGLASLFGGTGEAPQSDPASGFQNGIVIVALLFAFVFLRRLMRWVLGGKDLDWIEPIDLAQQLGSGFKAAIVDVRSPSEFNGTTGHIAGAINIPLDKIGPNLNRLKQMSERGIIAVCLSDSRAAVAASALKKAGIVNVRVLRGGMARWNALGLAHGC